MAKITHVLELTEDEAIALAMLVRSGISRVDGFVSYQLIAIGNALHAADSSLYVKQFRKWETIGTPEFTLKDNGVASDAS